MKVSELIKVLQEIKNQDAIVKAYEVTDKIQGHEMWTQVELASLDKEKHIKVSESSIEIGFYED